MIITILLTCLFLVITYLCVAHFGRNGRLIDQIPGSICFPTPYVIRICSYSPEQLWLLALDYAKRFYPISKFWILTIPNVLIYHPDDVQKVLSGMEHTVKGYEYKLLHPWLGDGLVISQGAKWHKRRKILTPAFHFSVLKEFVKTFIEEGNRVVKSFNPAEESIIEDVMLFTSHHTLNAICETSMGIFLNDSDQSQQYRQTIHHMGKFIIERLVKPWLFNDTIFNLTSLSTIQSKYLNILHSFTEKIIANRKRYHEETGGRYLKYFENNTETENEEVIGMKEKRMAMLDILLAESRNGNLTDSDIREEIDTFVFEGHDTVATSLCFSLLLLAEHKDIQDRVRKEINEVMQENNRKLTMNALQNLPYLERCLKESLRLYPSVPVISRICTTDLKLQSYTIPKGTTMHLFIYALHHDPNFWPNPKVFDPDRFLPENIQKRHPYSYLPFSAGLRNCIGQRFAMLELKAMIASLVYNFYLEPVDYLKDVSFKLDIVLRTSRPIRMKVIPIKRE
ncbi:cytochrome P450 4C1 isoform X2 [Harpegnathos saltator]|uniref:cytochrome P450 4C1 isoform X2 n=1 Tax=Harpegnathos saltator TaxID=610380 RepID=UPI000DBEE870|nr:cytochrome P450 4C1 isoform X2 [Harpegnathos saltator]